MADTVGDTIIAIVVTAVDRASAELAKIGNSVKTHADQIAKAGTTLMKIGTAGMVTVYAFNRITDAMAATGLMSEEMAKSLDKTFLVLQAVFGAITAIGTMMKALPAIIKAVTWAQHQLNIAMDANPIGIIILGIGILIALLIIFRGHLKQIGMAIATWLLAPIKAFLELLKLIGRIPGFGWLKTAVSGPLETINKVTYFQHGGIVRQPTLGVVGEAGPEAIIPLRGGALAGAGIVGNTVINVNVGSWLGDRDGVEHLVDTLMPAIRGRERLALGKAAF